MTRTTTLAVAALLLGALETGAAAQTSLLLPQSIAFSVLGHSCGGIQEQAVATGFDATSGFPTGDVYLQTRCGGSGRGGGYHVTTYSAWTSATWDYTGAVVAWSVLASGPSTIDPAFSAFDGFGNEIYETLNAVNVTPSSCTVGNTTYCTYRAWLGLAAGFVPPPRVTGVSGTTGPATGGTIVTITGTGFTNATAVDFGTTPAAGFTVSGDTSITATSPAASAGTVDVTVTTAGGTSAAGSSDLFTFVGAPSVSGVSPDNGPVDGGTLVTIAGSNLIDVQSVSFGDMPAGFTVNGDGTITAVSPPAEATDTVDVTVVTVGGTSAIGAADQFTYTPSVPTPFCGDGIVDPGEQCDDGAANGVPGDCCTITCAFQPADTPCVDDGDLCTADVCDGAGACAHPAAPSTACTSPDVSGGASLLLRATLASNRVQFKWGNGPGLSLADFGDPSGSDGLALCVYDSPDALAFDGAPSAGAWTGTATGWKFKSTTGSPDGITSVTLKAGLPVRGKVQVKATNGPSLAPLPLPSNSSVVAQVKTALGACWGATFSSPTVSSAEEFKAKSD